ncbi:hypothetical protein FOL75_04995 [Bacillus thuringiensis]|uniref:hypothetical protein n=1 Tax=Bacillus thuringiensis TaxID=1428 RepID=UPI002853D623|nr:hypothetical protein [Bacillus thuringiensis]MDR5021424.1 hypothetical protein [Bacillus thuringiensis]
MSAFKIGSKKNKIYYAIMIAIVVVLTICLTSKEFMFNDDPIVQTEFNRALPGLNYNTVYLKKWEYNSDKDIMQIHIKVEEKSGSYVSTKLSFKAKEKGNVKELPTKVVFNQDNMYVVQISEIPKEYKVVGLFVNEKAEIVSLENNTNNEGGTVQNTDNNNVKEKSIVLTGDYRKIKNNKDLLRKSTDEYIQDETKEELNLVKIEIKNVEKTIPLQDELSDKILNEIERIEANKQYQTEEEKIKSDSEIQKRKLQIEQYKKRKTELESKVKELETKEKNIEKKLEDQRKQFNIPKGI